MSGIKKKWKRIVKRNVKMKSVIKHGGRGVSYY
jgi:hypothetical protein